MRCVGKISEGKVDPSLPKAVQKSGKMRTEDVLGFYK